MRTAVIIGAAVGLVVTTAVVEGMRTNRWGASGDLQAAAKKLDRVPAAFGDWTAQEAPLDDKIIRKAEAVGTVSRIYVNRRTDDRISVLLLCGPAGPIGAHGPEVCYGGLGYSCKGTPSHKGFALSTGDKVSFWTARFENKTPTDAPLRVFWAWSLKGDWEATANPRTEFALHSFLYKVYMVQTDAPVDRPRDPKEEPQGIERFMAEFLPLVKAALADTGG